MSDLWSFRIIDSANRRDYHWLKESDRCGFFMEYTAGQGYRHSKANDFISNFKKKPSAAKSNPYVFRYKLSAIRESATAIAGVLSRSTSQYTLVPIPPSKAPSHTEYDDRCTQTLLLTSQNLKEQGIDIPVVDLVEQKKSTEAYHSSAGGYRDPDVIMENYKIKDGLSKALIESVEDKGCVVLFDDVLTTGAHFKAVQAFVSQELDIGPENCLGLFLARTIHT